MAETNPSPQIVLTTAPTTTTTAATTTTTATGPAEASEGKYVPAGPSTPQYKYLVLNHADTHNVKTILKYQYPDVPATPGYVHFTSTDPLTATSSGAGYVVNFDYAGTTPIESQFTISDSWITIATFSTDTANNTGTMGVSVAANSGNTSTTRSGTITFSGDISGATSGTNNNELTITQSGNMAQTSPTPSAPKGI